MARIISNFHDYYDGALFSLGWDIIYQRDCKKEFIPWDSTYNIARIIRENIPEKVMDTNYWSLANSAFLIRFCKKSYVCFEFAKEEKSIIPTYDFRYEPKSRSEKLLAEHLINKIKFDDTEPIYVISNSHLCTNCQLEPLKFGRIFHAYLAAQEIEMFLANRAQPEFPLPKLDDKTLIELKGFDSKTSFRKGKEH